MERPSKRPRKNNAVASPSQTSEQAPAQQDKREDEQLLSLLNGDSFLTRDSKEEEEARNRRNRRRQRLAQLEHKRETTNQGKVDVTSANNNVSIKIESPDIKHQSAISTAHEDIPIQKEDELKTAGDDDDDFDMFSSSVSPVQGSKTNDAQPASGSAKRGHEQDDWDDAEGYYKPVLGETIEVQHNISSSADMTHDTATALTSPSGTTISFKVSGVVGKGVFSTVLKCSTINNSTSVELPPTVAIKCVRHNETMAKAAAHEIQFLQQLKGSSGIVPLLLPTLGSLAPLEYRGHVLLVFPYLDYNLRDVLQKFGKGVGLSLQAVRSYFGQLLAAATHLKKLGILHADLKPDNIMVTGDYSTVFLADFGSAFEASAPENQPTPYLVSRFYRAPEIVMGLTPTSAIDLWSLAVTVAEIFLGEALFRGKSNNDMLYVFQQHMGPFSNRVIRQHLVQCQKMPNIIPRQFKQDGANYCFMQQSQDPISGAAFHKNLSLSASRKHKDNGSASKFPLATPLHQKIMKAKSSTDSRASVNHFSDLLQKCLALDPSRRIALKDALQHPFFQSDSDKAVP